MVFSTQPTLVGALAEIDTVVATLKYPVTVSIVIRIVDDSCLLLSIYHVIIGCGNMLTVQLLYPWSVGTVHMAPAPTENTVAVLLIQVYLNNVTYIINCYTYIC